VKRVTDKQLQFINFVLELQTMNCIKLNNMAFMHFHAMRESKVYSEEDIKLLDLFTKEIFEKPNVKDSWKVWSNI